MSKVVRSIKNVANGYTTAQVKVREATSNDVWGPTGTQMSEIAQMTFNSSTEFFEIVDMLDKRMNDKGKNWRHVLKALKVLDYCVHEGSGMVVTWAKNNIFVIKTLREFTYIDDEGRDVGKNVRVAAKELTALISDEERLNAERTDRRRWKNRIATDDLSGTPVSPPRQPRVRPRRDDENDLEYRLALEASKVQEEEDRLKRASRSANDEDDDDLAKAIKLSKEEEERRRRELEESTAASLFDDSASSQPQFTGFNQGYQQGNAVDFFANPIDQNQTQPQPTGYVNNAYTGFQQQPVFQNGYTNGLAPQATAVDPWQQQQQMLQQQQQQQQKMQQQQMLQPQQTFNPYAQQQQQMPQLSTPVEPAPHPGSNNPWSTNGQSSQGGIKPMPTGSNNPFASRPQLAQASFTAPTLSTLSEQNTLSQFNSTPTPSFGLSQPTPSPQPQLQSQQQQQQKPMSDHEAKLNSLLATGDGLDTFGNTGQLRIPAQHTAPGTFVNSAGAGLNRLTADQTGAPGGSNPFLRTQFTGMPTVSYGGSAQNPTGFGASSMATNPFGRQQLMQQHHQQQGNQGDLIQF